MGFRGNEANSEIYKRVREHFPEQRRTAIDCGAYVGEWTRMLAEDFSSVIAFEVRPENFAQLDASIPPTASAFNIGLGASDTHLRFAIRHGRYAQIDRRGEEGIPRQEFRVCPLDYFGIRDVDFIKVDVDGMEDDLLWGARETISRWRPVMAVEVKLMDEETKQRLLALLNYRSSGLVSAIDELWVPA